MQKWVRRPTEVRLSWVVPGLLSVGLLLNYNIAQAGPLQLESFAPVVARSSIRADYSKDALDLSFPPVDPDLADEILQDGILQDESLNSLSDPAVSTPLPTLPPLLPTQMPPLPTVPAIITQALGGVGDAVDDVGDEAGDIMEDTIGAVETLVPCVPIPLVKNCN